MKTAIMHLNRYLSQPTVPLPNAATRREVLQKILDRMLITASCTGIMAILLFLAFIYL